MSLASEIVDDLVSALRTCGQFAVVTLGDGGHTATPRAAVHYEGQEFFPIDDQPGGQFARLRCHVVIHMRCGRAAEQSGRQMDLAAVASEALLADPYRGGRCQDLPLGKATEVSRGEPAGTTSRPESETLLVVRCHFEVPGGEA